MIYKRKFKKITLMGYMASGKSTVGKQLATALNWSFYDLDDYIVTHEKMSVTAIFEKRGEASFREMEMYYLTKLLRKHTNAVIALGGGSPIKEKTIELINNKSLSVYLKATTSTLAQRLLPNTVERPLLEAIDEEMLIGFIDHHITSRQAYYEKAVIQIDVDGLSIESVVSLLKPQILNLMKV